MFKPNNNTRNLDYSWTCRDGQLKCANTHGLDGQYEAQWTIVNNEANCAGTHKPPCGASGPEFLPGNRQVNPIYDYIIKVAHNGSVKYLGAVVDGENEITTQIPGTLYTQLTGMRDVYSREGVFRFYPRKLFGQNLIDYNKRLAYDIGLSKEATNDLLKLVPMREVMLMQLEAMQVPVADQNNLTELLFKYTYHNPSTRSFLSDSDYALAIGEHTVQRKSNQAMDWGGLVTGAVGFISDLIQMGGDEATRAELVQYVNNYIAYMQTDFAAIDIVRREKGATQALAKLRDYKNGSWKELKDFIVNWCSVKTIPVPGEIIDLWGAQADFENALIDEAQRSPGGGTSPLPGGTGYEPPYDLGNGGTDNNNNNPKPKEADNTMLYLGIGLVALFALAK